ncbi:MAG TPA: alpha/beta hydrolase [Gemmatimonadales bacterium]|nr:alpha/beta hydrolase [Gemmatimonadales bacterium]
MDIATYVLIHGAGSDSWYWHRVIPLLRARGHTIVAPDLPCDDDSAGFKEYADVVVRAIGYYTDLIIVAQSLGGFTAPLVCAELPVEMMVLVAAMVPRPGESGDEWWINTGYPKSDKPFDVKSIFFHDVPPDVTAEAFRRGEKQQSGTPMEQPWPLKQWPNVPTRFLLCRQDRFFPADFMRRVVKERLGITPDEMDSGHLPALSHPKELVEQLETYRRGLDRAS